MKKYEDIKTVGDACKALGLDPEKAIPDFAGYPEEDREAMIAHAELVIVLKALNLDEDGKPYRPNWNNWNEPKYYAWFDVKASAEKPSGFGFSDSSYDHSGSFATVGSRLCSRSSAIALYAAKQFERLYLAYFLHEQGVAKEAAKDISINLNLSVNVVGGKLDQEALSKQVSDAISSAVAQ